MSRFKTYWIGQCVVATEHVAGGSSPVSGTLVSTDIDAAFMTVAHDPQLEPPFKAMSDAGQIPVLTIADGTLVAYGWLCTPSSTRPAHLPNGASGRYWIHYCQTVPEWRGRGLYKSTLRTLLAEAVRHSGGGSTSVHIDVEPENAPALAAARSVGFHSVGVAHALVLPVLGYVARRWDLALEPETTPGAGA